jgi:hypothetical protein
MTNLDHVTGQLVIPLYGENSACSCGKARDGSGPHDVTPKIFADLTTWRVRPILAEHLHNQLLELCYNFAANPGKETDDGKGKTPVQTHSEADAAAY